MDRFKTIEEIFEWRTPISQKALLALGNNLEGLDRWTFNLVMERASEIAEQHRCIGGGELMITAANVYRALEDVQSGNYQPGGFLQFGKCPVCGHSQEIEIENPLEIAVTEEGILHMELCMNPDCCEISAIEEWIDAMP